VEFTSTKTGWMLQVGLHRSVDGARSWTKVPDVPFAFARSVRFFDAFLGYWVGETTEHDGLERTGVIFASADGGDTWRQLDHGVSLEYPWRLRDVWPVSATEVWVVGDVLFALGGRRQDMAARPLRSDLAHGHDPLCRRAGRLDPRHRPPAGERNESPAQGTRTEKTEREASDARLNADQPAPPLSPLSPCLAAAARSAGSARSFRQCSVTRWYTKENE
jgi:hypothetical protein